MAQMTFGMYVLFAFLIVGCLALIGIIRYIEYLENKGKKKKEPDPLMKSIIATCFVIAIVLIGETLGAFGQGTTKKYIWVYLVIFCAVFGFYYFMLRKLNPLPFDKQYEIALKYADEISSATPYIGDAYIEPLNVYQVTMEEGTDNYIGEAGNFLFYVKAATVLKLLVQLDTFTGRLLRYQLDPPQSLQNKLESRNLSVKKDMLIDEFADDGDEDSQKNKEEERR